MLKRALRKIVGGQKGQVLPIVLILLIIGGLLIVPTLNYASTSLKTHQVTERKAEELYAADSGIEEGLRWLIYSREPGGPWSWDSEQGSGQRVTYTINTCGVNVAIDKLPSMGNNYFQVTSAATSPDGSTTVLSTVWVAPPILDDFPPMDPHGEYDGDVWIDGDATLNAHQHVNGDVVVTGDLTLKAHSGITGNITAEGDFTLNAQTDVTGNLCCGGDVTIKAQAVLNGDIYVTVAGDQTIELKGQATVGDIYVDGTGSITIILRNKDTCGKIYVTDSVTLIRNFHSEANHGSIDEEWGGENPAPPECPGGGWSETANTITYEII